MSHQVDCESFAVSGVALRLNSVASIGALRTTCTSPPCALNGGACLLVCRKQAEMLVLQQELKARKQSASETAAALEAILPWTLLAERRAVVAAEERAASLELMRVQSFLVQAEVKRQRILQRIASVPYGFHRCTRNGTGDCPQRQKMSGLHVSTLKFLPEIEKAVNASAQSWLRQVPGRSLGAAVKLARHVSHQHLGPQGSPAECRPGGAAQEPKSAGERPGAHH